MLFVGWLLSQQLGHSWGQDRVTFHLSVLPDTCRAGERFCSLKQGVCNPDDSQAVLSPSLACSEDEGWVGGWLPRAWTQIHLLVSGEL